jgi:histidyl-tRNA synthetase
VSPRVHPRTLKGFSDELPERAIVKERCIELSKDVFRQFGFAPIETPALEYSEVLLGKFDVDTEMQRQIYRFRDHGDRDVALRFDLTVPFARFAAQHRQTIGMPFRRYHIAPVWRGENPQAGRQREFLQCDIDIIGTTSPVADGEVLALVCKLMEALGVENYELRINHRQLLRSKLTSAGVSVSLDAVLRAVDKLDKRGAAAVARELENVGLASEAAAAVLDVCSTRGRAVDLLEQLDVDATRLREVVAVALSAGADVDKLLGRPLRQGASAGSRGLSWLDAPPRCVGATRSASGRAEHSGECVGVAVPRLCPSFCDGREDHPRSRHRH